MNDISHTQRNLIFFHKEAFHQNAILETDWTTTGEFADWLVNYTVGRVEGPKGMGDPTNHRKREEMEAPAETDHRAISESELVTVSAENLDQAEEKFDD